MNELVRFVHQGELLGPDDCIEVICYEHPLRPDRQRTYVKTGLTIYEIVEKAIANTNSRWQPADFQVLLKGGHEISFKYWHNVRPKSNTYLVMRPVAGEPISAIIGAITAAVSSISGAIAGLGFFGKLLMTAITFGAKFLLNKLFAPKQPERVVLSDPIVSYSITGSRNQMSRFGAIPVILGTHRHVPPYAAPPWTETVGNIQYSHFLFCVGYGNLSVIEANCKIGDTPITKYKDYQIQIRPGTNLDTATSLYPSSISEEFLSVTLTKALGFQSRTTGTGVVVLSVDFVWQGGLCYLNDQGKRQNHSATIQIEYRLVGAPGWTLWGKLVVRAATQDTLRRSARWGVASGQYEVRVMKISADTTDNRYVDDVTWTALRGQRLGEPVAFDKAPLCMIALRIKATDQLNGVIDTFNVIAQSRVTSWNGTTWVANTISSNPADLFRHVLTCPANKRAVPLSKIDLVTLQKWHLYCSQNGYTYNKPIIDQLSVYEVLHEIAAAGRAMVVWNNGAWSVVWDEQNPPVVAMFTPHNSWNFQETRKNKVLPHAYRAPFTNASKGYVEDERLVFADGYNKNTATIYSEFKMDGITNENLIWKHARYHLAQESGRPSTYSLECNWEGLPLVRNDRARIRRDEILVGLGHGLVRSVVSTPGAHSITLDETMTLSSTQSYGVVIRTADNTFITRSVVLGTSGELNTLPLIGSGSLPAADDLVAFGLVGEETAIYRVLSIEAMPDFGHRILFVDDAPGISLADTGTIPVFDSQITEPVDPFTLGPSDLRLTNGAYEENGQFLAFINASWVVNHQETIASTQVSYRNTEDDPDEWQSAPGVLLPNTTTSIRALQPGVYQVRVRHMFQNGTSSDWLESELHSTGSLLDAPADVTGFAITPLDSMALLSWDQVTGAGITYQVRISSLTDGSATWNSSVTLFASVDALTIQTPAIPGTYLIKAQSAGGTQSVNATVIITTVGSGDRNVVETLIENPSFAGVKDDTEIVSGELRLQGNAAISTWDMLSNVVSLLVGIGTDDTRGMAITGKYYFANSLDLGDVYVSRVTASISAYGYDPADTIESWIHISDVAQLSTTNPNDWSVSLFYRITESNPGLGLWSGWTPFVASDLQFRAIEFMMELDAVAANPEDLDFLYAAITPSVTAASVLIDMPDRVIGGNNIPVSVAGLTVAFDPPFKVLKGFSRSDQGLAVGDRVSITAPNEIGFTIQYFDNAGTPVARTFDYNATGYGKAS